MRWMLPLTVLLSACPEPPPPCESHTDCAGDEFCVDGDFCLPVFDRDYQITIERATVPSLGPTGGPWDPEDSSEPDLFALFGTLGGDVCATQTVDDTTSVEWNEGCEITLTSGEGFAIEVHDEDVNGQSTFIGGWGWETDEDVVALARTLGTVLRLESGAFSTEFRFDPPQ